MRNRLLVVILLLGVGAACSKAQTESISLCNRGVKAYQRGDSNLAMSLFEGAIALYPKNGVAHYQMGLILLHERKDFAGAERELGEAARLSPKDPEVPFQLGRLALLKGERDAALTRFQEALKIDGRHVGSLYWSGEALQKKNMLAEADDAFRKAIQADPHYARAFNALAMMYLDVGAEAEATAVLKEAIRLNPEDAESRLNAGLVYMAVGNDKEAVEQLMAGLKLDPQNLTGVYNLAGALIRLHRLTDAVFYLRQFITDGTEKGSELVEPARQVLLSLGRLIVMEERAKNP